jgi:hypothetical protein
VAAKIPDHITWKVLKSGTVLLNVKNGNYYTLNPTASDIWNHIIEKKHRNEMISSLCENYDCTSEQAEADVDKTITFLVDEGLLEDQISSKASEGGINEKRSKKAKQNQKKV